MLVDSHCHLTFPELAEDRSGVLARAKNAGVGTMMTICTKMTEIPAVQAVADEYDHIWCTVGVHPHEAEQEGADATVQALCEAADHSKTVGIGETGLDFFYNNSPRELQADSFRRHLVACRKTGLPVIVHTRDADAETCQILKEEAAPGGLKGVIHCFSSGREVAETALELGFMISLSGILTFKNAKDLRDIVNDLPLDRLLVETDAPFLAPVPKRGKTCEPGFVAHTAAYLAEMKGVSPEEVAEVTTDNFFRLFNKAQRPA